MKKTILVSNQRAGECIDVLNTFGIQEDDASDENVSSIDSIWEAINVDVEAEEALILIEIELNGQEFSLISHKTVSYDDLAKMLGVDYYQFNGYL